MSRQINGGVASFARRGFAAAERRRLLMAPGIGEGSVALLERAGFSSLAELRCQGPERVLPRLEPLAGPVVWRRRRLGFLRVLQALQQDPA